MTGTCTLPPLSDEQSCILTALQESNVITASVAGSGKTTLALHAVQKYTSLNFLIVTYNRSLSQDCKKKIRDLDLGDRVQCYTYHALMGKICKSQCFNDVMFLDLLENVLPGTELGFKFDVLIVDEMQDQRLHHYHFLSTLMQLTTKDCRFLFVGDPRQLLYDFYKQNPADRRYLEMSDRLFARFSSAGFVRICLSTSFRTTPRICAFVNHVCDSNMKAGNFRAPDDPVRFISCDLYDYAIIDYLYKIIIQNGAEHVMFISNTVSKSRTLCQITNQLRERGVNFFVSRNDYEQNANEEIRKGKVVVETYCGVKGLERKCIVVFGLDYTKENYTDKNNQIYVALTRSNGGQLYIIQDYQKSRSWVDGLPPETMTTITLQKSSSTRCKAPSRTMPFKRFHVSTVLDFIDTASLNTALQQVSTEEFIAPSLQLEFQSHVRFGKYVEDVRAIVACAIPMILEYEYTGQCQKVEWLLQPIFAHNQIELKKMISLHGERAVLKSLYKRQFPSAKIEEIRHAYMTQHKSNREWAVMANAVLCYKSYSHLLSQVQNYEWFEKFDFQPLKQTLRILKPVIFNEKRMFFGSDYTLDGRAHLVTESGEPCTFEFSAIVTIEHILRVALLMAISKQTIGYVCNLETGQVIKVGLPVTNTLLEFIISCKNGGSNTDPVDDACFIEQCFLSKKEQQAKVI